MSKQEGMYRGGGVVDIQIKRRDGRTEHTVIPDEHAAPTTDPKTGAAGSKAIEAGEHSVSIQTGE